VWLAVSILCVCLWVHVCMSECAHMESSFSMLLLGGPENPELKQLPICGTEEALLSLQVHQNQSEQTGDEQLLASFSPLDPTTSNWIYIFL